MNEERSDDTRSRRSVLKRGAVATTALVAGLAGCAGRFADGAPTEGEGGAGTPVATEEADTATERGGDGGTGTETNEANGTTENSGDESDNNRLFNRFVISRVEGYRDDYVGRIISINGVTDADTSDVPVGECGFADWSAGETRAYDAQFLDQRKSPPVTVPLTVYTDESDEVIDTGTHFIIERASQCPGDYVGVQVEWFVKGPSIVPEP